MSTRLRAITHPHRRQGLERRSNRRHPKRLTGVHIHGPPTCLGGVMRYLSLIYEDEKWWEKATPADLEKGMADYNAFTEGIKKNGNYIGGEALQPTKTATSVRVRNGKVSTTDGPYVETKEQLGGYYLINAKDLNEAVQVASRIPGARNGTVEVRPVMEFNQSQA